MGKCASASITSRSRLSRPARRFSKTPAHSIRRSDPRMRRTARMSWRSWWSPRAIREPFPPDALLPAAVALLERQDPHECFDGVDLAVVHLERLPHRQLIAAALAH